jgi:large conductance mechanosensitive channel
VLKGFGAFLMRGNVIDLAVAVVMGGAFGAIVTSLVKDIVTPLIAAIAGKPDFSALSFTLNNSIFRYGDFLNAALDFVLVSTAVYFFIVGPMNAVMGRFRPAPGEPTTRPCPECLTIIPIAARRCPACTTEFEAAKA